MSRALMTFVLVLAVLFPPAPNLDSATAIAAEPRPSISDIEDEVMCPICGTLLELSESPQAKGQRALVRTLIAEGKSKDEIKDALVAEYGRQVLAVPEGSGFSLSAYLIPAIAFAAAAVALAIAVSRWRTAARRGGSGVAPENRPRGEDEERLDADLARYDL
jgi:cytochrome c-type biogenesis protein CcmH